ncbi:reticulon-4a isoform X2 [Cololabis saira]|uniref:reticulon-4a isoform X2 n=1 Tax=Cololabis saira TaxID=129043 RepID=UPI002AD3369F|nr:reticulon-4a isoform X2 [Cololabis saira]
MAEPEQQVSSTEPLIQLDSHHYEPEPDPEPEPEPAPVPGPVPDLFSLDDIVDLVGGAQDALQRHMAADSAELEPEPGPEPGPDSTTGSGARTEPGTEPGTGPGTPPGPGTGPGAERPAPGPRAAAFAPAEDSLQDLSAATLRPAAPVPDEPSPSKAQPPVLMQFPTVVELLYWRDVKTTGVVFGAALLLLLSLTLCSIVSVCSYVGLALLSVTICFRIYKGILQAVQKSDEGHPFRQYLDQEVALSEDTVHKYSDLVLAKLNKTICEMRRLFLVEDLVDSIKFAVLMWILTYIGALFNGLTLLILGLVAVFSCPIVYEKHQTQIDHYVGMVNNQVKDVIGKIQAKVPGMKRKAE